MKTIWINLVMGTGRKIKQNKLYVCCLILILFSAIVYVDLPGAADYPHNESSNVDCTDCHTGPGGETHVPVDDLCAACHTGDGAPFQKTHSSGNTSAKYGAWSVDCITCHDPHEQQQASKYGSSGYLYSSASTSVSSGTEFSTISRTGAGWTAHQWQGMLVIGNTASTSPVFYKIADNTTDTLTVAGPLKGISQGDTFAIVYGALIKQTINYTKTNVTPSVNILSPTKFFRNTGENSFTSGTPTDDNPPVITSGICILCHTKTMYHRKDGSGAVHYPGSDCISCHTHEEGFKDPAPAGGSGSGPTGKGSVKIFNGFGDTPHTSLKELNDPGAAYDPETKVCTGIYCHSNGTQAGVASANTPAWGTTFAEMGGDPCAKCHANSPTGTPAHAAHVVGIHYDNIFTGTNGLAQPGGTASSAHGNSTSSTTINCNVCHYSTVQKARNKNNPACAACHSGDDISTALTRADLDKRYHVKGGNPVVSFAQSSVLSKAQLRDNITTVAELNDSWSRTNGYKTANSTDTAKRTPSYTSGSCSTVDCHNGNTVSWSAGSISCKACHTALPL